MTMTLDEVRKTRFHIARRNGYEVTDVDLFVDKVEATIAALTESNEGLQRQLDEVNQRVAHINPEETEQLRAEAGRLTVEANDLRQEVYRLQQDLAQAQAAASQPGETITQTVQDPALIDELQRLRQELAQAQQAAAQGGQVAYDPRLQQQLMQASSENQQLREQVQMLLDRERQYQAAGVAPQGPASLVVTTSPEASAAVVRLVQLATEQAEHLVSEAAREAGRRSQQIDLEIQRAKQEADEYIMRVKAEAKLTADDLTRRSTEEAQQRMEQANQAARALTSEAQSRSERTDNEARVNAERLVQEAQQRANMIDAEAAARRAELFRALESERDDLLTKVEKLKNYEASFRQTMTAYLKSQIERLDTYQFRPETTPELLQVPQTRSAAEWASGDQGVGQTPRLDALLRDMSGR
jgi:DivIVA domain-containing protein